MCKKADDKRETLACDRQGTLFKIKKLRPRNFPIFFHIQYLQSTQIVDNTLGLKNAGTQCSIVLT